jgi:hypothetical protein
MEYTDIIALVGIYGGLATSFFCTAYGARMVVNFFKDLAAPTLKVE